MTCCSLRDHGVELIGERFGLASYASCGTTMGMSVIHPWADRLSSWTYRARGTTVRLPVSPLLHTDRSGLPVNGVQSRDHAWILDGSGATAECAWLEATLPFDSDPRQLELFPFAHRVHLRAGVSGRSVFVAIEVDAATDVPVPVCCGFRIYLSREGRPGDRTIVLPARRRLVSDERLLPTGVTEDVDMKALSAGVDEVGELFALGSDRRITISSEARRVTVEPGAGFPFAQVRAVSGAPHVVAEVLTAAPNALNGDAFPVAVRGRPYHAALRLTVDAFSPGPTRLAA